MRMIDADSLIDLVENSSILSAGFKQAFCKLVAGEPTVEAHPLYGVRIANSTGFLLGGICAQRTRKC